MDTSRPLCPLARIDLLIDNAGYELVADLALADFLLAVLGVAQVVMHVKTQPRVCI